MKKPNIVGIGRRGREDGVGDEVLPVDHELDNDSSRLDIICAEEHLPTVAGNRLVLDDVSPTCTPVIHRDLEPVQSRLEYGQLRILGVATRDVDSAGG